MMLPENNNLAVTTANLLLSYVFRIRNNLNIAKINAIKVA